MAVRDEEFESVACTHLCTCDGYVDKKWLGTWRCVKRRIFKWLRGKRARGKSTGARMQASHGGAPLVMPTRIKVLAAIAQHEHYLGQFEAMVDDDDVVPFSATQGRAVLRARVEPTVLLQGEIAPLFAADVLDGACFAMFATTESSLGTLARAVAVQPRTSIALVAALGVVERDARQRWGGVTEVALVVPRSLPAGMTGEDLGQRRRWCLYRRLRTTAAQVNGGLCQDAREQILAERDQGAQLWLVHTLCHQYAAVCAVCRARFYQSLQHGGVRGAHAFIDPAHAMRPVVQFRHRPHNTYAMHRAPSLAFTWFKDLGWRALMCRQCHAHVGWDFTDRLGWFNRWKEAPEFYCLLGHAFTYQVEPPAQIRTLD